jgi:hypothetical protein
MEGAPFPSGRSGAGDTRLPEANRECPKTIVAHIRENRWLAGGARRNRTDDLFNAIAETTSFIATASYRSQLICKSFRNKQPRPEIARNSYKWPALSLAQLLICS